MAEEIKQTSAVEDDLQDAAALFITNKPPRAESDFLSQRNVVNVMKRPEGVQLDGPNRSSDSATRSRSALQHL